MDGAGFPAKISQVVGTDRPDKQMEQGSYRQDQTAPAGAGSGAGQLDRGNGSASGRFSHPGLALLVVVGGLCLGIGVVELWRYLPKTLGILSLLAGAFFLMTALGDPDEMAVLVYLAAQYLIVALASLLVRKRQDPYDRAARNLLRKRNAVKGLELARFIFSEEKFSLGWKDASKTKPADEAAYYRDVQQVIEAESILLIVCCKKVLFLQKKDLLEGTIPELRAFLRERVPYVEGATERRKESVS